MVTRRLLSVLDKHGSPSIASEKVAYCVKGGLLGGSLLREPTVFKKINNVYTLFFLGGECMLRVYTMSAY